MKDYRYMNEIQEMAATGNSIIEAMGTRMYMPSWDEILILELSSILRRFRRTLMFQQQQ